MFPFLAIPGPAPKPGDFNGLVIRSVMQGLATALQYIIPVIGIAGAGLSLWRRRQRQGLVTHVSQSKAADALDGMSWREFEVLVGEAFRLQGFRVAETRGGGADGGVELVLTREGARFLVQCKQWKAYKVGVEVVRELFGVMAARGAGGGLVVTSGTFTNDARAKERQAGGGEATGLLACFWGSSLLFPELTGFGKTCLSTSAAVLSATSRARLAVVTHFKIASYFVFSLVPSPALTWSTRMPYFLYWRPTAVTVSLYAVSQALLEATAVLSRIMRPAASAVLLISSVPKSVV